MTTPLLRHQQEDVEFIHRVKRGLLANEPGTGKSRSAIEAVDGGRVLVVAPGLVLDAGTWDDELAKWAKHPEKFTQAKYTYLNARMKTGTGGTKPVNALRDEFKGRWDAVVIDEAHYVKGRDTSWTWAVQEIAKTADVVLPMTGTPIPNWAHEIFTLLQLIYPQEAKRGGTFGSFWRWAGEWFDTAPTRFSNGNPVVGELAGCQRNYGRCKDRPAIDPCEHWHAFVEANLGRHYRRVFRKDVLDLPPCTFQRVLTPMDAAGKKAYAGLKKNFATTVNGEDVLAWSQGAQNVLLDKCTVSPWLLAPSGPPRGGKFERLRFDLASRSAPTLVLAHYRDVVEACAAVASSVGASTGYVHGTHKDADAVRAFKDGRLDVLVGSLETLAEGLQLTAADVAIFVEHSFKPSRNEQARMRIDRLGQTRATTILDYTTPNTVDQKKRVRLETKTDQQMRFMTAAQFLEIL